MRPKIILDLLLEFLFPFWTLPILSLEHDPEHRNYRLSLVHRLLLLYSIVTYDDRLLSFHLVLLDSEVLLDTLLPVREHI